MLFHSATVVAALVLDLAGAAPIANRTAARSAAPTAASASPLRVAAGLWAPKKSTKPKASKDDGEAQEEDLLKPRKPVGDGARPGKRRPIKMDDSAEEGDDEAADEGDDEDDEDRPKVVKKKKRVVEEEEEADEPIASQASVIPRLVNFELGPAMMRRSFAYNVANEQGDKGFRFGYQFAVESFPAVTQPGGWYRTLGLGAYYEKEYGDSTRDQPSGVFMGAAVNHSRWGFDARYAIPAGEWVIIMPALGYGRIGADLERMTPTVPSMCMSTNPDPCFGDIKAAYLSADLHVRFGISPRMALALSGGYLQGLGVARGNDQITAEASASMKGFHVELGGSMLLGDYLAVTAQVPFRRYSFAFSPASGGAFTAKSAADTYYGLIAGLAVMTK